MMSRNRNASYEGGSEAASDAAPESTIARPLDRAKKALCSMRRNEFADLAPEKAMSPEERQLLTGLFERIEGAAANPRDKEAESFIQDAVRALPYAPYLLAQTVIVQDQALRAANDRLQQLEGQVRDLQQQASQPQQGGGGFLGGLGSLFGGGNPPPPVRSPAPSSGWQSPPQQGGGWQQPPQQNYGQQPYGGPQPGPWGSQPGGPMGNQGGGFLKGALGAAAGVAGGVLLADSIKGLFGGHNNALGIGSGVPGVDQGLGGDRETVVNNYYGDDAVRQQDARQDADQDQDDAQDASDNGSDYGSDDSSTDV
jgi:hypothetical protein